MRALGSAVLTAALYAAVCAIAYRLALHLTGLWHAQSATLGALWAGISALVVLSDTFAETLRLARMRIAGAIVGTAITAAVLTALPFSFALVPLAIALTVLLCRSMGLGEFTHLASIAVLIGMAAASQHPDLAPWLNGSLRLAEAAVGMSTAVLSSLLATPIERLLAGSKTPRNPS